MRAQIDRLTPWTANDAAFGWSDPVVAGADRIVVTVAATARALVQPLVDALVAAGAEAVAVTATPPDAAPITVLDHHARGALDFGRVRGALVALLIGAGLLAGISLSAAAVVGVGYGNQQDELTRRINERRAMIRAGRDGPQAATPLRALERRKYQSPSSVIVLEVLSQILPDHTYVTELRIEGDKVRVTGVTRDAPELIRLLERSPNFTRATFFAPTTRGPVRSGRALPHRGADRTRLRVSLMSTQKASRLSSLRPMLAVAAYAVAVVVLLAMAWSGVADILDRRHAIAAASDLLAQLEGRKPSPLAAAGAAAAQVPTGSPFLEGQTLTVAGAALLQRVADAVNKVGGNVLSSQVDVQGVQAKDGFVNVLASCELDHAALQRLLYDLEAGMPFLFLEQVVAQSPQTASPQEGGRMRLLLAVSGRWQGDK